MVFKDSVVDYYYPKGGKALEGFYENGFYNDSVKTYYKGGLNKASGLYNQGTRDGLWTYYYKNQNVEKVILFRNAQLFIKEFYKKNGKAIFLDGNGIYKGLSNINHNSCWENQIKGSLVNGRMTGKWNITIGNHYCVEEFENGVFNFGTEYPTKTVYDSISIINPAGFPYYENITLLYHRIATDRIDISVQSLLRVPELELFFIPELKKLISKHLETNLFFYALIEFKIENGQLNTESFKKITNNEKTFNELKNLISTFKEWGNTDKKVIYTVYLPVFWQKGNIYLKPSDINKFH